MAVDDQVVVGERIPAPTAAERAVADLLPIDADHKRAAAVLERIPFWFHTFAVNGLYTSGVARDHRYRVPFLPEDLRGKRVLDVGAFDGFYSFLAESRGAERVIAVDNEQYRAWVRARWGIELEGGEGFRAIAELIGSRVDYRKLDAFDVDRLGERFDLIICFGILHRVAAPLDLLATLRRQLVRGGEVLLETHGITDRRLDDHAGIHVCDPGEVYARDEFVYWGFSAASLDRLARHAGFERGVARREATSVDGHPRVIALLRAS